VSPKSAANAVDSEREEADENDCAATATAEPVGQIADSEPPNRRRSNPATWIRSRALTVVLAVLLVAASGLAAWLYVFQYRPDQQSDAVVAGKVVKAASDGTVAILSYKPDTAQNDFVNAKSHLTGGFLSYYNQFASQILTPAVRQKAVRTTAVVVKSAISQMQSNSAVVLLFVNQSTSSSQNPEPTMTASSVKVGLKKVDDVWLISSFDPV
jgi:Mce-associated membrane protein